MQRTVKIDIGRAGPSFRTPRRFAGVADALGQTFFFERKAQFVGTRVDDRLGRKDFRTLARTIDLSAAEGDAAIDEVLAKLGKALDTIAVPDLAKKVPATSKMVDELLQLVRDRLEAF
jgi:hypothetical protein